MTENNLLNIVRQASINIVLATGMTVVILTAGIDLSIGSSATKAGKCLPGFAAPSSTTCDLVSQRHKSP